MTPKPPGRDGWKKRKGRNEERKKKVKEEPQ